jgi:hypothetical protein
MNPERDPVLEALFAQTSQDLVDDGYTARVMEKVERRRRYVTAGRLAIVMAIFGFDLLLSSPLQHSLGALAQVLATPLLNVQNEWLASLLAPLNSIAGVIGMLFLALHMLYRRMIR